jgi:hypothetical protein
MIIMVRIASTAVNEMWIECIWDGGRQCGVEGEGRGREGPGGTKAEVEETETVHCTCIQHANEDWVKRVGGHFMRQSQKHGGLRTY